MSYRAWWGEIQDPNASHDGSLEVGQEHEPCRWRPLVIARALFVAFAVPLLWALCVPLIPLPWWQGAALVIGGTLIYVAVSYLVQAEPNMDNIGLGWRLGDGDEPGQQVDHFNRLLVDVALVLGPGRFVAESLLDFAAMFRPREPSERFAAEE